MNFLLVLHLIGHVLKYEALLLILPLGVSFLYGGEDAMSFIISILLLAGTSAILSSIRPKNTRVHSKEGFLTVALSWIFLSGFGALPFYFCNYFPSYIDCFFEAVSGFTTAGSTILAEVESLPKGILFWRSFTHWIGGMGILVFVLAIMPSMNASTIQLLKVESPGPNPGKIVPKVKETAKILYIIYFMLTILLILLLLLSGLPLYDSVISALGTAGTGGFSNMNISIGAYNNIAAEIIITVFMIIFGVNFSMYYFCLNKNWKQVLKDEELRTYLIIVVIAMIVITIDIMGAFDYSFKTALRYASFQVSSIISTTGYSTTDFNLWPTFSKAVLIFLMFTGSCAGSTAGGLKMSRIVILAKTIKRDLGRIMHPNVVKTVKMEGSTVDETIISNISLFFFCYIAITAFACILVALDGYDLETTITSVVTCIGNVGPGLGLAGPMGNFGMFSGFSKIVLSFCMLAGRLEIFPMLIIFCPSTWKNFS